MISVGQIMDYESGVMGVKETVEFFSELVKSGMAWTLQGHYGRTATSLIKTGLLDKKGNINQEHLDQIC